MSTGPQPANKRPMIIYTAKPSSAGEPQAGEEIDLAYPRSYGELLDLVKRLREGTAVFDLLKRGADRTGAQAIGYIGPAWERDLLALEIGIRALCPKDARVPQAS